MRLDLLCLKTKVVSACFCHLRAQFHSDIVQNMFHSSADMVESLLWGPSRVLWGLA